MAGLSALVQRLERFAAGEVKARIASKVRDAMHAECIRGFTEERDPYGTRWAPRKKPKAEFALRFGFIDDHHKLLDKSGRLIDTLTARATGSTVVLRTRAGYARYLQTGTYKMVPRMIFPDPSRGLGTWSEPVHRAAVEAVQELMR